MAPVILKEFYLCAIIGSVPIPFFIILYGGDTMYETKQFTQASLLLMILTVATLFTKGSFPAILLVGGIFMLFFTFRSLAEKTTWYILFLQFFLSAAYILISGNIAAYLILFEFRVRRGGRQVGFPRLILPSSTYLAVFCAISCIGTSQKKAVAQNMPHALFNALLLFAAALFLAFVEYLITSYLCAKNETARVVSMTALAELYEKKMNQELVMKNYLADKTARLEERENISRNIHNSVGHSVTAAIVALDAAELLLTSDPERAREKLQAANRRIRMGLDSIRQAVRILDEEADFLPVGDFIGSLQELAQNFRMDTARDIRLDIADIAPGLLLPHEYSEFLNGAVSELLTNGIRHGNADRFTIHFAADSAHIRICVEDNGTSDFSQKNSCGRIENGYGLKKIRSFVEKCGGSAVFGNDGGFRSMVTLPLYKEDEKDIKEEQG